MLSALMQNAEDGALAVGEQTVALYDANGEMRPMPDVIADIIRATEKMSDEQRDAALSALFGEQALGAFNAIAGQGADAVSNLASELYNAGDRKSTRLNSSHVAISYAVFCLKYIFYN